jgi:hypothetical protein
MKGGSIEKDDFAIAGMALFHVQGILLHPNLLGHNADTWRSAANTKALSYFHG